MFMHLATNVFRAFVRLVIALFQLFGYFFTQVKDTLCLIYGIALGRYAKKTSAKSKLVCAVIATAITTITIFVVISFGSIIWNGVCYTICSIEKHLAIAWASDKGDWVHWMTGGRYLIFKTAKEELISSSWFAAFVSGLAGKGFFFKCLQIAILLICDISFFMLIALEYLTVCSIYRNARQLICRYRNNKQYAEKKSHTKKATTTAHTSTKNDGRNTHT
jgi:hypothetical protein